MFGLLDMIGLGSKPESTAATDGEPDDTGPKAPWERSVKSEDIVEGGRQCFRLQSGRGVLLVRYEGEVHCLDSSCYHRAAPLLHGDIEDLGGESYIVCPLHEYKINLATGEALAKKKPPGESTARLISKGFNQRIHEVHEGITGPKGANTLEGTESWIWIRETTPVGVRAVVQAACATAADTPDAESGVTAAPETGAPAASSAAASSGTVLPATDVCASVATPSTTMGLRALRAAAKEEGEAGGPATTALAAARFNRTKLVRREHPPEGWVLSDDCAHLIH